MILADEISCILTDAVNIACQIPSANGWEIASAIGTVGAALTAGGLGYLTWRTEQKARTQAVLHRSKDQKERSEKDYQMTVHEQFMEVSKLMRQQSLVFPFGKKEDQIWFEAQYYSFIWYLRMESTNEKLAGQVEYVCRLFGEINHKYSAETSDIAEEWVGESWGDEETVVECKKILTNLSSKFSAVMGHWSRAGQNLAETEGYLSELHDSWRKLYVSLEKGGL